MRGSRRHVGQTGKTRLGVGPGLFLGPVGCGDAGEVTAMPKLSAARVMIGAAVFAIGILTGAGIADLGAIQSDAA
jgi:hypothetical protein